MATFKIEIRNRRADGTSNVKIRVTHNGKVRRMPTNIYVTDADITKGRAIKNANVLDQCQVLLRECREACNGLGYRIADMSINELIGDIKAHLMGKERFTLDFIAYGMEKTAIMKEGTASTYVSAFNALRRYMGTVPLDILDIDVSFLRDFERFIETEPSQHGSNRRKKNVKPKPKGGRAVSAYLACVRAIHNRAKVEFNDDDKGVIRIPYSPFNTYKIKPQPRTRKRAVSVDIIQKIIDLPYTADGAHNRFNLAKDCFILSFALMGMNSADLYDAIPAKGDILVYNRRKTASRRDDNAEMHVRLEPCLSRLLEKYADKVRMFKFYRRYSDIKGFNRAINFGLKQIGAIVGVDDLEFYAARHSWATVARSAAVGIDKMTVHEGLNHVDEAMKVTDIYIDRDWSTLWNANAKVLAIFDWTTVGYDVL